MGIREAIINDAKEQGFEQGRKEGIEQGIEQGMEQGIEQKERQVIARAWAKGFPIEEIAELADVSIERVEAIIRELQEKENGED